MKNALVLIAMVLLSVAVHAQTTTTPCEGNTDPATWLNGVIREAISKGVSQATLQAAADYLHSESKYVQKDGQQQNFYKSFLDFYDQMVTKSNRLARAQQVIKSYSELLARIERDYGVPPEVLVAYWGLESDFGKVTGKDHILTALTTLAYNCRRAGFFRAQLIDALRVAERDRLRPDQMLGTWAGEMGPLQITPSDYFNFGQDYDHDGVIDLIKSIPDTLATAANFLLQKGWQRGQPWLQEVRVPATMPWEQADQTIQLPRGQWAAYGIRTASGQPLPNDSMSAALILPMGRLGPAFLAYSNFLNGYLGWNAALNYSLTAAYLANRISPTNPVPAFYRGSVPDMDASEFAEQLKKIQRLLNLTDDGWLGLSTRAAIRKAQLHFGLPADSYPTPELLARLRQAVDR